MPKKDLEERTASFGLEVVRYCQKIPQDAVSRPLISQLVRAATSIGANYAEAQGASSKKDFANKIYISRKEAREARHWLKMFSGISPGADLSALSAECHELILILQTISSKLRLKT